MKTIIYSIYDQNNNFIDSQKYDSIDNARKWHKELSQKLNKYTYGVIN